MLSSSQTLFLPYKPLRVDRELIERPPYSHRISIIVSIEVVLQWIPGHIGIKGNEAADNPAKQGAALPHPDIHVSFEIINTNIQGRLAE